MNGQERAHLGGAITLSGKEFARLSEFIHDECGIKVTEGKKIMLEGRLQKRLRKLGLGSFSAYCDYLFSPEGMEKELTFMIDEVTTNKTDFFREPAHFRFLAERVLPEITRSRRHMTVWSAGCSTGEEPYTLAMVLSAYAETLPGFEFLVLATDISTSVLSKAEKGIYEEERVAPVPLEYKRKYLLRSRDRTKKIVRIMPELRSRVRFRRLNFMDGDFGFREPIDVIFCRNVIIYFDKPTQEKLLNRFCRLLAPGGYVFMGHSEALIDMNVPLTSVAPTVYKKR